MLMDVGRALRVMADAGLDGLVATSPPARASARRTAQYINPEFLEGDVA